MYNKKIIASIAVLLFMGAGLFTGCGKTEAIKTDEVVLVEDELNNIDKNDEIDKDMMAGVSGALAEEDAVDSTETETEEKDSNTLVFEDKSISISILTDKELNSRNDSDKYGELRHVTYYSTTCEKERGMNVMLPYGYSEDKEYPVLYVLHGIFGDEYSMCGDGKNGTPALIDNLISMGEAKEMIVVYPHMFASKDKDQCEAINEEDTMVYDNFVNDLTDDIMPYMAANYSVAQGKENTAVIGFSMGGREALQIGLLRPDLFGYVGSIAPAPGLVPGVDKFMTHPGSFTTEQVKYDNEAPFLIMICAGDRDSVVGKFPKNYHELYQINGIDHIWWEIPGSDHGDPAISSGIYNFVRYIFK